MADTKRYEAHRNIGTGTESVSTFRVMVSRLADKIIASGTSVLAWYGAPASSTGNLLDVDLAGTDLNIGTGDLLAHEAAVVAETWRLLTDGTNALLIGGGDYLAYQ